MTILATDTFSGADADPIGGNWTAIGSAETFQRQGNVMLTSLQNTAPRAQFNAYTPPNDSYCKIRISAAFANSTVLILGRLNSADEYYYFGVDILNSIVALGRRNFGFLGLDSDSYTTNPGDEFTLEMVGTSLVGKVNGVAMLGATDSDFSSGSWGVTMATGFGSPEIDYFEGGDFAAGSGAVLSVHHRQQQGFQ